MANWYDYVQQSVSYLERPYPVLYDKENTFTADVLIIGGGVAGYHAAINVAKRGARVVVMDKGPVRRGGCCVGDCPIPGANKLNHPLNQRMGWKRKETGKHFRIGMKNPPPPYTRPPVD